MKKLKRLAGLILAVLCFTILLLVGCAGGDKVATIALKDVDPETPLELEMGKFDYSSYVLTVTYATGKTEELPLTEEMIVDADLLKFHQEGNHTVTLTYGEATGEFLISVKRNSFKDAFFRENYEFTYDGTAHVIEVEGDLPADATVVYPGGNSFVNADTYDVTAVITCEGYVTQRLSTTVTVHRASHDMSGLSFDDLTVVYNGVEHGLTVSGTVPEGLSAPTYQYNGNYLSGVTDAGTYQVTASFTCADPNYEQPEPLRATLTVEPAEYRVDGLSLVLMDGKGTELEGCVGEYGTEGMQVTLNDLTLLPQGTTVSYLISYVDKEGNVTEVNEMEKVGTYRVKAVLNLPVNRNYKGIDPIECEIQIIPAKYDLSGIELDTGYYVYREGESYSLCLSREPDPTQIRTVYTYYLNGELVTDEQGKPVTEVTAPGVYEVRISFENLTENYLPISEDDIPDPIKRANLIVEVVENEENEGNEEEEVE